MPMKSPERRAAMAARRDEQRARVPGFMPVSNRRIELAYAKIVTGLLPTTPMAQAQAQARRLIASGLPPLGFERRRLAKLPV